MSATYRKDGGPAFPDDRFQTGMSLRDWFAGKAMQGSRARASIYATWGDLAKDAYEIADAMLAARAKEDAK
jgi:hypothetical protein